MLNSFLSNKDPKPPKALTQVDKFQKNFIGFDAESELYLLIDAR